MLPGRLRGLSIFRLISQLFLPACLSHPENLALELGERREGHDRNITEGPSVGAVRLAAVRLEIACVVRQLRYDPSVKEAGMTIEDLIDIQEEGGRARGTGLKLHDNPYLRGGTPFSDKSALDDGLVRHNAWKFGWEAEDASRDESVAEAFRMLRAESCGQRYSKILS